MLLLGKSSKPLHRPSLPASHLASGPPCPSVIRLHLFCEFPDFSLPPFPPIAPNLGNPYSPLILSSVFSLQRPPLTCGSPHLQVLMRFPPEIGV